MNKAPGILIKTKWKKADIDDKSVEFSIATEGGIAVSGIGHFIFCERPDGQQEIIIQSPSTPNLLDPNGYWLRVTLTQQLADLIERQPEGSQWEFRCVENLEPLNPCH